MGRQRLSRSLGVKRLLAFVVFCFVGLAQADSAHPAIWTAQGKHNTVYLVGTMHYLHPEDALPDAITQVYARSKKLLMEIDLDDLSTAEAQQSMLQSGLLPDNETLEQRLGAHAYAELSKQATKLGVDTGLLSRFQPWLAALMLEQFELMKMGMDASSGVEQQLVAKASADHKEIQGLETLQEQLDLFAKLNNEQQREFLLYTLSDIDQSDGELESMLKAWRSGDTKTLSKMLQEGLTAYPDLYRALTTDRNSRWMTTLKKILDQSDEDYLVAVGTLHLVGKDSVVDLLERAGYKVMRQ